MDRATSLLKALDVLTILGAHREGRTVQELAATMNLARTTVIRILNTILEYGLVEREGRIYRVSAGFRDWARPQRHNWMRLRYRKWLEAVADASGELVLLGLLEGAGVVHIDYILSDDAVRVAPAPLTHHNIRHNAIGKLVLSQRPDMAQFWIDSDPSFAIELEEIRETGVAWNREETVSGMVAMAVDGLRPTHTEPKIAVAWPVNRFCESKAAEVLALIQHIRSRMRKEVAC